MGTIHLGTLRTNLPEGSMKGTESISVQVLFIFSLTCACDGGANRAYARVHVVC